MRRNNDLINSLELAEELERLRRAVAEKDNIIEDLRLQLRSTDANLKVSQVEIRLLSEVIARDRTRVQAETAMAAQQIAAAMAPRRTTNES